MDPEVHDVAASLEPLQNANFLDAFASVSSQTSYLTIVSQPKNKFRFRYACEKASHGAIKGENDDIGDNFPIVKLNNYQSKRPVYISASLYTNEDVPQRHVHYFSGFDDGICTIELDDSMLAVFNNLRIVHCEKRNVQKILLDRNKANLIQATKEEHVRIINECKKAANCMNLKAVKICFEAWTSDEASGNKQLVCQPVFSQAIMDQGKYGDLVITCISACSGFVTGGEFIILLCEKVDKNDIKIIFEELGPDGNVVWKGEGKFLPSDVHHEFAIPFKTPEYCRTDIHNDVHAYLYLYRPSDGESSAKLPFCYKAACDNDSEGTSKKRKKMNDCDFLQPGTSGMNTNGSSIDNFNNSNMLTDVNAEKNTFADMFKFLEAPSRYEQLDSGSESDDGIAVSTTLPPLPFDHLLDGAHVPSYELDSIGFVQRNLSEDRSVIAKIAKLFHSALSLSEPVLEDRGDSNNKDFDLHCQDVDQSKSVIERLFRFVAHLCDKDCNNLLHVLLRYDGCQLANCFKLLRSLLEKLVNSKNKLNQTPMHCAISHNYVDISNLLLLFGDPNIKDSKGNTALHLATEKKAFTTVKHLLRWSKVAVDIDAVNYEGLTPLHCAILSKNAVCVELLCGASADVNKRDGKSGRTALHLACENFPEILNYLMQKTPINVDAKDFAGNTALDLAMRYDLPEAVQILKVGTRPVTETHDSALSISKKTQSPMVLPISLKKVHNSKTESISFLDHQTMKELCILLDPPEKGWKILATYVGIDEHYIDCVSELDKNPTQIIIRKFQETGHGVFSFMKALELAKLTHAHSVVRQFVENTKVKTNTHFE